MTPRAYATAQRLSRDPGATLEERDTAARRCAEYEQRKANRRSGSLLPWWQLRLFVRGGPRDNGKALGITSEFRQVLRGVRIWGPDTIISWRCYYFDDATLAALQDERIDWTWFPDHESVPTRWRPPADLRSAMNKHRPRRLRKSATAQKGETT